MSDIVSDWQSAVVAALKANLQGGTFTVESGRRDGTSRDRQLACVFGDEPMQIDTNPFFCRPVLKVRAWLPNPKQPRPTVPRDETPLQQLEEDLLKTLQPLQSLPSVDSGRGLYAFVSQIRRDTVDWGVEVTLTGWTTNPAVAG